MNAKSSSFFLFAFLACCQWSYAPTFCFVWHRGHDWDESWVLCHTSALGGYKYIEKVTQKVWTQLERWVSQNTMTDPRDKIEIPSVGKSVKFSV